MTENLFIHIAFTLCEKVAPSPYSLGLAAAYSSIRTRTQEKIHLHVIVDDSVSEETRQRLFDTIHYEDRIRFYESDVVQESDSLSSALDGRYSRAIIWRAWIAEYLSHLKKCILLDCDLIFNFDIKSLYQIDLNGHAISASLRVAPRAKELHEWLGVPPEKYFRQTCVVLNLEYIRNDRKFCSNRVQFLKSLNRAARKGLRGGGALEQSLFNHHYFDKNIPFDIPLIPVDRLKGHPRASEWQNILLDSCPRILDIKGWESQSKYSEEFWDALSLTSWGHEVHQLRLSSGV